MENNIYLCFFFLLFSGVSSQSVNITEDTVYIMNNVVGQVTCTLYGNCSGINWYVPSTLPPVASAFVNLSCLNITNGFYQTCDNQNHQYTLYFTGTTNLHGQTLRCSGEACSPQQIVSDTVKVSIIVPVSSVTLIGIDGQQITVTAGQSKSLTCVTGKSRPIPRILWYIGVTNVTSMSIEESIPSGKLFYTRNTLTLIPTKSQNGLQVNCKAYNTDTNMVEVTTKPTLNVQYPPDDPNAVIKQGHTISKIQGNSTTLVCEVRGGNPLATITWNCFKLTATSSTQGDISRSTLNFIAHKSHNKQTCTCRASHPAVNLGSDSITINVYFAAKVTSMEISDGNSFTIPEHASKTLTCLAEGLPQPKLTLSYISNSSIIKSVNGLRLDFTFFSARCEDTGIYKCNAINMFTPQQPLQKTVIVLCQPRAAKEPLQNRYALSVGQTLNITVPYLAYPRPTFQWFKNIHNGSTMQIIDDQDDVQINDFAINTYTYVTQLMRRNLKEDDFGTYILTTSNVIGQNEDAYIVGAKDVPESVTSTGLAVGAGLGSAIVITITVLIVIFVVRRFRRGFAKGKTDVELNGRSALTSCDGQKDGMRDNEPAGPNFVRLNTSGGATGGISSGATGGQNDYPDAEVKNNEKIGLDNAIPVYAEVLKNPKAKKTDPSTMYADVQKPEKENKGAKLKKMFKKIKAEKEKQGDLYENVEKVNKGNSAAAGPTLVTKQNKLKPAKPPKVPKRIKDGLIYVDLDLEEPVTKSGQKLVIRGLEDKTDYADIDITRHGDHLPQDDKSPKDKKDFMP